MKRSFLSRHLRRSRGVALVLVLCFVVLITGLVVAFFSRALTTRQLANASTSTTQVEIIAGSAVDVILGDLKTEIANGSATPAPAPVPTPTNYAATNVYAPKVAAYAVPQRNVPPPSFGGPGANWIPNLVRRSLREDTLGGANAFPSPAPSPVPAPAPSSRASASRSDTPNSNGRYISNARWNRHYLIPTIDPAASPAPGTSVSTDDPATPDKSLGFTAPDWVFVTAEKGPAVLSAPFKDSTGASITTTGRYAYAIYDEGGLLDINQTGYLSASLSSPTGLTHVGAKPAPSYADLTQLPPPTSAAAITQTNVDKLLGWRNYATLQTSGTFPDLSPGAGGEAAYYNLFASNIAVPTSSTAGLLQVPPTVWQNNKTDQRFLSRQQLIGYFTAAGLDLRYLQYFTTFSRSLNQPSYLPEHSPTSVDPGDTTEGTRPSVLPLDQGGNDAVGNNFISPNFLTARVVSTFPRYDKTAAIVGEPLVKKRFPLNRLAWLTYQGPSATRFTAATDALGSDADIVYLKMNGITKEWLDQGNDENILKYFGLRWTGAGTKWVYSHGTNTSGSANAGANNSGAILNINNPGREIDVMRLKNPAREPDFFELLKAAINPGSIAKSALSQNTMISAVTHGPFDQRNIDTSVDIAILQIGANIIDQFDTDGVPTVIRYDLLATGNKPEDLPLLCGDENLPYISRVRSGLIHLKEADPVETATDDATRAKPIKDTGLAALMNYPEIWNLHDWSTDAKRSLGAVAPSQFKIFARTNDGNNFKLATTVYVTGAPENERPPSFNAIPGKSPGFMDQYHFASFGGGGNGPETRVFSEANTKMTFTIDTSKTTGVGLFREPTLLFQPNVPVDTLLASPALVSTNVGTPPTYEDGLGTLAKNGNFFNPNANQGGLKSAAASTSPSIKVPQVNDPYIGFYIGAQPMRFWITDPGKGIDKSYSQYQTEYGPVDDLIYTLACQDPTTKDWIPYDVKRMSTNGAPNAHLETKPDYCSGFNGTETWDSGLRYFQTIDPRTGRFGMFDPYIKESLPSNTIPPRGGYSGTLSKTSAVLKSDRETANSGTGCYLGLLSSDWFQSSMGWYPGSMRGSSDQFRPGMFSQNNPAVASDGIIGGSPAYPNSNGSGAAGIFYADADGVVRRAMGGNVNGPAGPTATSPYTGLPMAYGKNQSSGNSATSNQVDSRPVILNRPFRSVAELGYVYSGTPWKNLDFFLPESGNAALLDVFCVVDNSDTNALTAGQVNLNTHQSPVLQAILAQASKDQWRDAATDASARILGTGSANAQAKQLADLLVTRTATGPADPSGPNFSKGPQPLQNVSDLIGRWVKPVYVDGTYVYDGKKSSDGFAADLGSLSTSGNGSDVPMHNTQRFAESAVRALSNAGQTRVWNLMFDVVAQTGRYSPQATKLEQFNVEGEQHYWVHVALDRYTGQVLDKQVEVVKE